MEHLKNYYTGIQLKHKKYFNIPLNPLNNQNIPTWGI